MTIKFRGLTSNADGKKAEYFVDGKVQFRLFPHKTKDKEIIEQFRQAEKSGKLPPEWTSVSPEETDADHAASITKDRLKFSESQWGKIAGHFGVAVDDLTLDDLKSLLEFYAGGNKIGGLGDSFRQSLEEQLGAMTS